MHLIHVERTFRPLRGGNPVLDRLNTDRPCIRSNMTGVTLQVLVCILRTTVIICTDYAYEVDSMLLLISFSCQALPYLSSIQSTYMYVVYARRTKH
jgi:hypothetical protein